MQISRLRLQGFKSFVEPTDLIISSGLTGVVGPNGCGKSNLLEALRWVMGETSHKSMRAAQMDDVIFSGTERRPARNMAEVIVTLDNSSRTAPAEFNDSDIIEISRRIEREAGSAFRINGKDTRARDVRLIFEDAATGARSNALVRQGQIGELVNAKPDKRRRILEDAAGIAGLHSRRHEAELRLQAAENNLARVDDILGQLTSQINGLKRQARQAKRYREITEEMRRLEALQMHFAWLAAEAGVDAAEGKLRDVLGEVGRASEAETAARTELERLSDALGGLRDHEMTRAAVLQRLAIEQETLARDEARVREALEDIRGRIAQTEADKLQADEAAAEAGVTRQRLHDERTGLTAALARVNKGLAPSRKAAEKARDESAAADAVLAQLTTERAERISERRRLEAGLVAARSGLARAEQRLAALQADGKQLASDRAPAGDVVTLAAAVEAAVATLEDAARSAEVAENNLAEAAKVETAARDEVTRLRLQQTALASEVKALRQFVSGGAGDATTEFPSVLDRVTAAPGFEKAVGAAFGDDLDASLSPDAPMRWADASGGGDRVAADLPPDVRPLCDVVEAPAALAWRIAHVGLVGDLAEGNKCAGQLSPGQSLVSREGALWRWDGFCVAPDVPGAAAKRLMERNRLAALEVALTAADAALETSATVHREHVSGLDAAKRAAADARDTARAGENALAIARNKHRDEVARHERFEDRARALVAAEAPVLEARDEAVRAIAEAEAGLTDTADAAEAGEKYDAAAETARTLRAAWTEAEAGLQSLEREASLLGDRDAAIGRELDETERREKKAKAQIAELATRHDKLCADEVRLAETPDEIEGRRLKLTDARQVAERERQEAADALATAETDVRARATALKALQAAMTGALEARARSEAQLEAARDRRSEQSRAIREALDVAPDACLALAGYDAEGTDADGKAPPDAETVSRGLDRLKADRERLGGVNLRAEDELETLSSQHDSLDTERRDLEAAIAKLRQGIQKLNREGRRRLLEAYEAVNAHFQRLFTTLFGGGTAELQLIEGDDPLEGGLELIARPPGKKPATLSLLSGGEQALTAMALIFAVFLTNPSPICVLDEVDAPLDDSNVGRFCRLLDEMAKSTDTRFLVITHHPMTMSRMDRLYGVTMAEKGISQLVSVDIARAETLREAS